MPPQTPYAAPQSERQPPPGWSLRDRATGIIAFGAVLALLYFGRDVLIPLTLALMLSLLVAPLVRLLMRAGLGQAAAVFAAVSTLALAIILGAVVLGTQMLRMAASLPQYQETVQQKLQNLDDLTAGRLDALTSEASRLITKYSVDNAAAASDANGLGPGSNSAITIPLAPPEKPREPGADPFQIMGRVLTSIWAPAETAGIVVVVLIFVLLEHEALRDRFIRVAGGANIRQTTLALNDAGQRLSRFFVSQFAVNLGVGAAIGLGLTILGLPHAMLWGTLAGALRFVPYVGIWIAALFATILAIAVVPGWTLALSTFGLFVLIELLAAQLLEPQLYGHATGLSPLSVVVAAIFWGSLWGPMGLVLSTPLTLCLVVGGRHIKALVFLDLLLGDAQALTLPQKFYQRAISGDSQEIILNARAFLKNNSFADYCDRVLLPALHMGLLDLEMGAISQDQQNKIRDVIVTVVSTIDGSPVVRSRRSAGSVLEHTNSGRMLRQQRERLAGPYQGPVKVARGSVTICVAMGSMADDIASELLVRILREQKLDARHFSVADLDVGVPAETTPGAVAIVCLVSAFPSIEREQSEAVAERVRHLLSGALIVNVFLPGLSANADFTPPVGSADFAVATIVHAVQVCVERYQPPAMPAEPQAQQLGG
jgi:predicted PurR-regulated permease PerM